MKKKKDTKKNTESEALAGSSEATAVQIQSKAELKSFLMDIRDKLDDEQAPAVFALTALNNVMNIPKVYEYLDNDNREIARDIWLRIKRAGFQLKDPPLLFETA